VTVQVDVRTAYGARGSDSGLADSDLGDSGPADSESGGELRAVPRMLTHRDQQQAPLVEAVSRYRQRATVSFHCPAHRGGQVADADLRDLVGDRLLSADVWLDPAEQHRVRRRAEDLAADLWGADRAFLLGNGSSGGNHAALLAMLQPGDEVVVARDAHISTLTGLVMTGARPVWVTPDVHAERDVGLGVAPEALAATLRAHPSARAVVLVSPSYAGVCSDLPALVRVAHDAGAAVLVDEAWGAHLPFHPGLPIDALSAGADAVVTSTHKLAGSLSQSALLLVRAGRIDIDAVATAVRMTATTSPLLPLLASIDSCRRHLALDGHATFDSALARAARVRSMLDTTPGTVTLSAADLGLPTERLDPLKLVVDVTGLGRTGVAVERLLRERCAVAVEGSDLRHLFLVVTGGGGAADVARLAEGLSGLAPERVPDPGRKGYARPASSGRVLGPRPQARTPREAYFARQEPVSLRGSVGRIAAELVTPYPPGIPVLVPGEVVDGEQVAYLRSAVAAGVHIHGAADSSLATVRVMVDR
jgi:arginine/lysine/ornithine decarboxylase